MEEQEKTAVTRSKKINNSSVYFLIISNCIPLVGVLFFGWDLFLILLLYWSETIIIGFYSLIKIFVFHKLKAIYVGPFFVFHFGFFMFLHLLFITVLFGGTSEVIPRHLDQFLDISYDIRLIGPIFWPFVVMFLSHGYSFINNYIINKEYLVVKIDPFISPYGRVVVMHLTVMAGGFLSMIFHQAVLSLVVLILLKTAADLFSHARQHGFIIMSPLKIRGRSA